MAVEALAQGEITERLGRLTGWSHEEDRLVRSYRLGSHFAATAMVVHIAQVQEELNHHSELTLGYDSVRVAMNTHSAGGKVTDLDFGLAHRIEELAPGHGAAS